MKKLTKRQSGWLAAIILISAVLSLTACQPSAPAQTSTATAAVTATPAATATPTPAPTSTPITLEGATTTDSGLQYLEITAGTGEAPKKGNIITLNYIASLPDGTVLADTYTQGSPVSTVWGEDRLLPGWEEGVGLMKVGEKAKIVIPPDLAFGDQGSGSIPPGTQIVIEMELLAVKPAPSPTTVAATDFTKTESGLQYYDIKVGEGNEAAKNFTVSTNYILWVKSESGHKYIAESEEGNPVKFIVGRGDTVFPGWDEGVTGMKVGGKRLLIVPAELGLGEQSNDLIPANSVLVLEIELTDAKEPRLAMKVDEKDYKKTDTGLKYYDITPGTGASPQAGQTVTVHYTGWLEDGTQFDSSVDRGEPFTFVLGQGDVIPGWDEGVATMKVGGKRQLVVPANLAYGDSGAGSVIPPGATLIFEVELLSIQ